MSSVLGECFVVLNSATTENAIIFGRNSMNSIHDVQEVIYVRSEEKRGNIKCDGGVTIEDDPKYAVILSKTYPLWGSESGANDQKVCIGITWSTGEPNENSVRSTDLLRLTLERSSTADEAVNIIGRLYETWGNDNLKCNFVICDPREAWIVSLGKKLWAAEKIELEKRAISCYGLEVTSKIDKSIENLENRLKDFGIWDGNGDLNFAKSLSSAPNILNWPSVEKSGEALFDVTDMFEVLRATGKEKALSSHVSMLKSTGISCHWFTATPNPSESVFKPFVFTLNARISPLTKVETDNLTLLYKLHKQRNWENVGNLLKSLEATCVQEVKNFLREHTEPNEELDDLMKDCVEAEVKFYR